jgi:hypothetical protein
MERGAVVYGSKPYILSIIFQPFILLSNNINLKEHENK